MPNAHSLDFPHLPPPGAPYPPWAPGLQVSPSQVRHPGPYPGYHPGRPRCPRPLWDHFLSPSRFTLLSRTSRPPQPPTRLPGPGFTSSSALPRPRTFQVCPTPRRGPPPTALGLLPLLRIPHPGPQPPASPGPGLHSVTPPPRPPHTLWTPPPLYTRLAHPYPGPLGAQGHAYRIPSRAAASRRRAEGEQATGLEG